MPELSQGPMDGSPDSAAEPLRCLACGRPWTKEHERWHAFIADLERSDGLAIDGREVGVFCPDCSRQEFGEDAY
jgi:DNA-directed RNA polymerase subunit N (RpoN/RPB10)